MLTLTRAKPTKRSVLRNAEYYDFQDVLDKLYADSEKGYQFKNLMVLIYSPENIMLAYRNIKKNSGSKTAGVDKKMSVEYNDNRLSLYCSQQGKCAVTGMPLEIGRIHCHHRTAKHLGGNDSYTNLILVDIDVHTLIHATKEETIQKLLALLQLDKKQLTKINRLRNLLNLNEILQ